MHTVPAPSNPLVTIGIPCYNSEKYLAQSIESLLTQSYRNFVMVICDNASTDATADICRRYAALDARVQYHRNPVNIGMTGNFNRVFELTRTKYLKWSTADDYWAPDMVGDAVAAMEADPSIAVCYPRVVIVDADGKEQGRYEDQLHLMQDDPAQRFLSVLQNIKLVNHHLGLLRTDAIRRTQLFGKHVAADVGFVAELSLYGKFYQMPKYQFFRRFHADSSSWQRGNQDQQARRFHAANVRKLPFNTWRFHSTFSKAVLRGPLSLGSKFKLLRRLAKHFYWDREPLWHELRSDFPLTWRAGKGVARK
jgi:glycosyltransferase involved in cell wall biosynthesis